MCCGEESPSSTPRVGARVDFFSQTQGSLGNLLFLNPSSPSSPLATHARFSPKEGVVMDTDDSVLVSIHLSGDMTKSIKDCGLFRQFTLQNSSDKAHQMVLDESLSLDVGQNGIIGRRVSMMKEGKLLGDGIVGFNSVLVV
ncbi:hypothetical protein B0T17DRAFT_503605 [Bombardia bombarda]|uniref:Uncharacterized protein n=1 Tax=Bombardia bombarda TaxID=252184 RepID=A0AA40CES8_9PEZI|nr:hypothetical protein B0T17DRAFT_503605 [Bombardia bombarda]